MEQRDLSEGQSVTECSGADTSQRGEGNGRSTLTGRIAGQYRILERIGAGGLGEVFMAEDIVLGRRVALKFVTTDSNAREQILFEARLAASLDHPYICKVFGTGDCDGKPFIAMEYLDGQTLCDRLKTGCLPLQTALTLAAETAEALGAAHEKNMIHCDLKPANIMVTASGHVKLMDFGLARSIHMPRPSTGDPTLTMKAAVVAGTPAYMAPEQATGEKTDARTDVFALGIVLFEMLTGVHPFRGKTQAGTMAAIVYETTPDIARHLPEANASLRRILNRALAKAPAERYSSGQEMAAELIAFRTRTHLQEDRNRLPGAIAILPFTDLSPNKDQEYFCDGLAEELIVALGRIERLRVVSRSASFRYRDGKATLGEIGSALDASTVLEGSVRKAGERLRIVVNLIDPKDGCPVWSERYDRTLDDIFEIQDDIARAVAEKLRVTFALTPALPVPGIAAYELYLKGRYFWNKRTEDDLRLSIDYFRRALAESPDYALASAGLADAWVTLSLYGAVCPPDALPVAREAAERALSLQPALPEALTSRACVSAIFDWDQRAAEKDFEAAIAANPRYAQARQWFAMTSLLPRGQFDRARGELSAALQIEPISRVMATSLGVLDFYEGDYAAAIERLGAVLRLDDRFYLAHYFLGQAYSAKDMHSEAIGELERAFALSHSSECLSALGYARAQGGHREEALDVLRELAGRAASQYVSPVLMAWVNVGLGNLTEAAANIEQACRIRATDLIWVSLRPAFRPLLADGRIANVLSLVVSNTQGADIAVQSHPASRLL